jgi:LysR family transcriptional regulator, hydrogen peroxide-inducible genes activator
VDTHRHFGRAAAACFVSQPTLSAGLKKLEGELGVVLFDRSRQPVVPMEAGARVLARARAVLREAAGLAALADADAEPAGELRLGVIPTVASALLPLVAGPFAERYPRVVLSVHELTTDAILEHLATERIDAGVVATDEARAGLHAVPLFDEPFVAYVGAGHRVEAEAVVACDRLAPDDVWLLSEGHCFRDQVLHLCGAAPSAAGARTVRFESGTLETLRRMVDRAGGVTLLPELATLSLTPDEAARVRPLEAPVPKREVRLVTGRPHLKQALVEAFAETVRREVAAARERPGGDRFADAPRRRG